MELNHFTLTDGTMDVSHTTMFIRDTAQKRRSSFLLLCLVAPVLAGLMAWHAYQDGNPLVMGTGIIVVAGIIVLLLLNRHQWRSVDNLILLENIKEAHFDPESKKKSTMVTLHLRNHKKRQVSILKEGSQTENLRQIFAGQAIRITG